MKKVIDTIEGQIENYQEKAIMKSIEGTLSGNINLIGTCTERYFYYIFE